MLRRPPRATLFPCPSLFRSAEEKRAAIGQLGSWACRPGVLGRAGEGRADALKVGPRYFVPVALGQWILLSIFGYDCRGKTGRDWSTVELGLSTGRSG
ncbi:MAG: hypothetical protein GY820_05780 [Gammaproteobacteria bacterium]|nr:hypothetical protein [Gammaproteobacteria bacterium]